ncbi:MAG: glycosyltransferase family 2 protein [Gallionellaceae bacterium]|nr:glycosyltransferase family 2 protein [Gallionellaceae bacterium]
MNTQVKLMGQPEPQQIIFGPTYFLDGHFELDQKRLTFADTLSNSGDALCQLYEHAQVLPKVAILLCTYHGQHYLADQLDSFAAQSYPNWEVLASDDGSQDNTHAILEAYRSKWGKERLSINFGLARGFAANFLSLTCSSSIKADYYAYSDQDDIWEADKLQRAINWLLTVPKNVPALYCSRTRLVDVHNRDIGFSPLFNKPPSFANALMQNVAGGNTMVFNNAARALLCETGANADVVTHDWWAYLLVSGCGKVFYDAYPSIRYRQHEGNILGVNSSWVARFKRIRMLFQGHYRAWNNRNIQALQRIRHRLTPENQQILDQFVEARNFGLWSRLIGLKRCGVYRQTLLGNLGLIAGALFKKI